MKLPRNLDAKDLIKSLSQYGYFVTRQTGSHIRLTSTRKGEHHLTIPNHSPLKTGTLSAIIQSVATHFEKPKQEIIDELFS